MAIVVFVQSTKSVVRVAPGQPVVAGVVSIPAGTFEMGTDSGDLPGLLARYRITRADLFSAELPRRTVRVEAFRLDRTEVTKAQFAEFLRAHPEWARSAVPAESHPGRYLEEWNDDPDAAREGSRPVAAVTWRAAAAFCGWRDGRLPREAEWEYAARGGLINPEFPWGDDAPDASRANWRGTGLGSATTVASFAPNGYGLYDMAGNVWEFMADPWSAGDRAAAVTSVNDPTTRFVIRGGSYDGAAVNLRVRYRDSHPGGNAVPFVGFRCAY